jgi:hypothetical protein
MKSIKYLIFLPLILLVGCSSLILKPVYFAWPVESVVNVDNNGNAKVDRYSISFNAQALFLKETGDTLGYQNQKLRIIRNSNGYYFMTANNFKNVYVFSAKDGNFHQYEKIGITDSTGMQDPAFNQRPPFIELTYNSNQKVNLTEDGIKKLEEGK